MERDNKQGTSKGRSKFVTYPSRYQSTKYSENSPSCLELTNPLHILVIGVQQLDIVKFALPLVKISFHPIFSAVGKHTNFFMSEQAASRPQLNKRLLTVLFG